MVKLILASGPFRMGGGLPNDVEVFPQGSGRWRMALRSHIWRPPTDVYETDTAVVVRVEIAGMKDEDFSVSLTGRNLVIRGFRPDAAERKAYHQMEILFGVFRSEVELPGPVITDRVRAEYQKGFLTVILPKQAARKIQVED